MAAGLAVAAGLEQKPYAPLWLCGRTAITCFGDIVVSDNSASWFKPSRRTISLASSVQLDRNRSAHLSLLPQDAGVNVPSPSACRSCPQLRGPRLNPISECFGFAVGTRTLRDLVCIMARKSLIRRCSQSTTSSRFSSGTMIGTPASAASRPFSLRASGSASLNGPKS
jgi:hypothetical protein